MNYGIYCSTLPKEKPNKTIGRSIIPVRKVMNGILYVLNTDWLSMENAAFRIWFWFNLSQKVPRMG
jgi:hypothetical protein